MMKLNHDTNLKLVVKSKTPKRSLVSKVKKGKKIMRWTAKEKPEIMLITISSNKTH